ncbi:MAG TPA: DUF5916 domain-containing protein [Luteimonas sp.]|nr:DUF5916 domain-containing protein [Luteimonas sp.]
MRCRLLSLAILAALAVPAYAIEVDGRIDPAEWQGAEHITDFRLVQPLSGAPSPYPTEAWVLSTPEGLAIGFRNVQPASVPRNRQRTQRDQDAQLDRVNLMVDFDGDGRSGYNFTLNLTDGIVDAVITNESNFSKDWDGNWQHAVSEDGDTWSAEMLIPWYIAPMRKADGGKRTLGVYLDRVIGSTGERVAWPAVSFARPRFLSDFSKVTLPAYSQSLLAITPYAVGVYDNVHGRSDFDAGADIFWKPNGQTQLTATINPDFGQVESDELVVNFGAEETFFSDKRPFFTENQGIFDFGLLIDNSQLIYTRRVGGAADDGSGAGDIAAAVKLNGSFGATNYGVLAAEEKGDAGRSFRALRLNHDFGTQTLGLLATQVERPFLDREATVLGIDHRWQPNDKLTILSNVVGSAIDQYAQTTRGYGATLVAEYEMNERWRQQWLLMHFDDRLDINDFGFLGRNNLDYAHWQVSRRFTHLPESSAYSSHDWRFRIIGIDNDDGLTLKRQFRASIQSDRRDGGNEFAQFNLNSPGYEDRLSRGNGVFRTTGNASVSWSRNRPRKGDWAWEANAWLGGGEVVGNRRLGLNGYVEPTYFFSDALSAFAGLYVERTPDLLVWQGGNLIGNFDEHVLQLNAGLNWTIGSRQELRVKLQALGLDAKLRQGYRVEDWRLLATDAQIDDFSLRNLGFQIRYRYELAPLSNLYIAYVRGGFGFDGFSQDVGPLLSDSFSLRDSEQLLVKLSYRFEL